MPLQLVILVREMVSYRTHRILQKSALVASLILSIWNLQNRQIHPNSNPRSSRCRKLEDYPY